MNNVFTAILLFTSLVAGAQTDSLVKMAPGSFLQAIQPEGTQLLDVRTSGEFNSGHIKNALQADWTNPTQFHDRIAYIDRNKPVFVYCLVGGRSAAAATWMRQHGFGTVIELAGGMNAWKAAGNAVDGKSSEPPMTMQDYLSRIPADKTVLVDVGAPWCPPCVKMEPVINELKQEKINDFILLKIDAGVHIELLKSLGIEQLPVFIVYKKGTETWRKTGQVEKEELKAQLK